MGQGYHIILIVFPPTELFGLLAKQASNSFHCQSPEKEITFPYIFQYVCSAACLYYVFVQNMLNYLKYLWLEHKGHKSSILVNFYFALCAIHVEQ